MPHEINTYFYSYNEPSSCVQLDNGVIYDATGYKKSPISSPVAGIDRRSALSPIPPPPPSNSFSIDETTKERHLLSYDKLGQNLLFNHQINLDGVLECIHNEMKLLREFENIKTRHSEVSREEIEGYLVQIHDAMANRRLFEDQMNQLLINTEKELDSIVEYDF